jgi:hypothetical protein
MVHGGLAEGEAEATIQALTHFSLLFLRKHSSSPGMLLDAQVRLPFCMNPLFNLHTTFMKPLLGRANNLWCLGTSNILAGN